MTHRELFILMNDRLAYDKALEEYNSHSRFYRLFHKAPQCPTIKTAKELAQEYTEEFNKVLGLGTRKDYGNGDTSWVALGFDSDTCRPVLECVIVYHGCIFQSRKYYKTDGGFKEWGICGRYRDGGMTLTEETVTYMNADYLQEAYNEFKQLLNKVANDFWF